MSLHRPYKLRRTPEGYGERNERLAGLGVPSHVRERAVGMSLPDRDVVGEEQEPKPHPATLPENVLPAIIDAWSAGAKTAGSAFGPVV